MDLTAERLRKLLHYNTETGVFTRRVFTSSRANIGDVAGSPEATGHRRIRVDVTRYLEHRLAWLYVTGSWPNAEIDHIDGNGGNNIFSNLREATRAENSRNRRKGINNTSTYKGVYWDGKKRKWRATIYLNKKHIHIGHFDRSIDAFLAYSFKALALHSEFARIA